ncbi:GFA family protein [uncultured Microbulbifer sp.]|uniref:GFA family protein n=1 Tax=uncultured Microbulbifer sp. TaxID=348147 RepID=UPI00261280E7|nr:GFA family protein [uncultured Microbulbifer sp.]
MGKKCAYLHLIVPTQNIELICRDAARSGYTFNIGVAKHYFCCHRRVKSFYIPHSNLDGYSLNTRCLDECLRDMRGESFDEQNREQPAAEVAHLSMIG